MSFSFSALCQPHTVTPTCLTAAERPCGGLCYTFTTNLEAPVGWNFGDGTTLPPAFNQFTVTHCFTNVNTYDNINETHTVTATNYPGGIPGGSASTTVNHENCQQGIFIGQPGGSALSQLTTYNDALLHSLNPTTFNGMNHSKKVYVYGIVQIDKPSYTFQATDIKIEESGGFNVPNSRQLTLQSTELSTLSTCPCLWRGIEVIGGSLKTTKTTTMTTIRDALYAVRPITLNGQPTIRLRETRFINNYIGLMAANTSFSISNSSDGFSGNEFSSTSVKNWCGGAGVANPFAPSEGSFSNDRGWAGVYLSEINNFRVPASTDLVNTFRKLANGIYMVNSSSTAGPVPIDPPSPPGAGIRMCRFLDIQRGQYSAAQGGHGIYFRDSEGGHFLSQAGLGLAPSAPTFTSCEVGIHAEAQDGAGGGMFFSSNNLMTAMETGYEVVTETGGLDIDISENEIESTVYYSHHPEFAGGVRMETRIPALCTIEGNTIIANQPGFPWGTFGIFIRGTNPDMPTLGNFNIVGNHVTADHAFKGIAPVWVSGVQVRENAVEVTGNQCCTTAIWAAGGTGNAVLCNNVEGPAPLSDDPFPLRDAIIAFASTDIDINDNQTLSFDRSFVFQWDSGTGVNFRCNSLMGTYIIELHYDGTLGAVMTGPQFDEGNTWDGAPNLVGDDARNLTSVSGNEYRARTNPVFNETPPDINDPSGVWFSSSPNEPECPADPNCELPEVVVVVNSADVAIAEESITSLPGWQYSTEKYLYAKLKDNPTLLDDNTLMQSFVDARENTPMGDFYEMGKSLSWLFYVDAATQAQLDANKAGIFSILAEIEETDSLLATSPAEPQYSQLQQQLQNLHDTVGQLKASTAAIFADLHDNRVTLADSLRAINSLIDAKEIYELNEKQVNDLFLQTIGKDNTEADSTQLATLLHIATQCPDEGGRAVLWAIALYEALTDSWLQVQECDLGFRGKETHGQVLPDDFRLFPNPTTGEVQASYRLENHQIGEMLVFDQLGNRLAAYKLSANSNTLQLNNLPTGIYFVHFLIEGKTHRIEKLVKL